MKNTFRQQIKEDIEVLKENLAWDSSTSKDEYTFNYWILSNIYNLDEEECSSNITEYNDKGIDCFVHYEDDKELYIIQNKYYDENTRLSSKELSDFLTRPLSKLNEGTYTRSPELQEIYNQSKKDSDYKVFLHFYITNDLNHSDLKSIANEYKSNDAFFEVFFLSDLKDKYYGKAYSQNPKLNTKLNIKNKGTYLAIRPLEYDLPNMSEAYYVMAKVPDVFKLWQDAESKDYPLFEENIREYLGGTSGINKAIISTLKNPDERGNFFYYNNGITVICDNAKADSKSININNPQIVNGCQTVNSIAEVLKNESNPNQTYSDVYVMVKILVLENKDTGFYRDIVRYTNSQNAINEKVFGATLQPFFTIQDKLMQYGILTAVKQSDSFQFKQKYKDKKLFGELKNLANKNSGEIYKFDRLTELQIKLESLLQIIGALFKDGHFAYAKKSYLLKPTSKEYYQSFSCNIGQLLTIESMSKVIFLYKRAEKDKKDSDDKKSPSPYYLLNFIGHYLRKNDIDIQSFFKTVKPANLLFVYEKFKILSNKYIESFGVKHSMEYNVIIKQKIDLDIMDEVLEKHINALREYNQSDYAKLMEILK
jgi:hypothetical protein